MPSRVAADAMTADDNHDNDKALVSFLYFPNSPELFSSPPREKSTGFSPDLNLKETLRVKFDWITSKVKIHGKLGKKERKKESRLGLKEEYQPDCKLENLGRPETIFSAHNSCMEMETTLPTYRTAATTI